MKNLTTTPDYPKTLFIRNHKEGLIWQIYNVNNFSEAVLLSMNAKCNGFYYCSLEEFDKNHEETFPTWRNEASILIQEALELEKERK